MNIDELLEQGVFALESGDAKKALDLFVQVQNQMDFSAEVETLIAEAQEALGRHEDAIVSLRNVIAADKDDLDARYALGDLLFEMSRFEQARQVYIDITEKFADEADAWVSVGLVDFHQDDINSSIACYEKALAISPDSTFALNSLGDARFAMGDVKGALETFKSVIDLDPKDPQAHYNLAEMYYDSDDLEQAEIACQNALDCDRSFSYAYLTLGNLYLDKDQADKALHNFQEFLLHENSPAAEDIRAEVAAVVDGLKAEL